MGGVEDDCKDITKKKLTSEAQTNPANPCTGNIDM